MTVRNRPETAILSLQKGRKRAKLPVSCRKTYKIRTHSDPAPGPALLLQPSASRQPGGRAVMTQQNRTPTVEDQLMHTTLGLDTIRPAVVTIDVHRGHLDPTCATLPLEAGAAAAVVAANKRFLDAPRAAGIPIVHA